VEQWGYNRYWLAEHHSIPGLACSATPVLIGHLAAATKTIRVGSGGVMLPNHAPLVVAEQFGTLEALYPGRIDLGLGRAPGGDFQTMRALRRDLQQSGDDFPALLAELQTYLGPESPGQVVKAIPGQGSNVPITLLGSSGFSAQLAAMQGLAFAFAAHFAPELLYAAAQLYREEFRPSEVLRYLGVSFTAVMPGSGRVGGFRIPPMHGKLGISTSNHEPVDGIRGHESNGEYPSGSSSSSGYASTTAGATILPPAFAFGRECGSGDGVLLALRIPYPPVAHLPAARPPAASTVPTTPRYPRLDLDATATVVDDVV